MARERSYQAFRYLNDNSVEQYIIVQDPLLINDVSCPKYGVNLQPYFITLNVAPGQEQQMAVNSEQAAITSNLYENNFILSDTAVEMIQELQGEPDSNNLKQNNQGADVDKDREFNGYAQIALSDEQYQVFQEKGWILLEIADKVFLLDSSGLHDVTGDPNLINKLKDTTHMISMKSSELRDNKTVVRNKIETKQLETLEKDCRTEEVENVKSVQGISNAKDVKVPVPQDSSTSTQRKKNVIKGTNDHRKILIHSTFKLKDIPREVVLGKTIDGKKLIARVIKGKGIIKQPRKSKKQENKNSVDMESKDFVVSEDDFAKLVENVLLGTIQSSAEDNAGAKTVVAELLEMPEYESTLPEHMLIVTKTIREFNEHGILEKQHRPTIITGRVIKDDSERGFVHMPYLLQEHMMKNKNCENRHSEVSGDNHKERNESSNSDIHMFVHINISETKTSDNVTRVSVTVHKRHLSLSVGHNDQTCNSDLVYICSLCLREFKMQRELQNHQEQPCPVDQMSLNINTCYTVIRTVNNTEMFICNVCKKKFSERQDCHYHLRTHTSEPIQEETSVAKYLESFSDDTKHTDTFICKICARTFEESVTLTKHILEEHINRD